MLEARNIPFNKEAGCTLCVKGIITADVRVAGISVAPKRAYCECMDRAFRNINTPAMAVAAE